MHRKSAISQWPFVNKIKLYFTTTKWDKNRSDFFVRQKNIYHHLNKVKNKQKTRRVNKIIVCGNIVALWDLRCCVNRTFFAAISKFATKGRKNVSKIKQIDNDCWVVFITHSVRYCGVLNIVMPLCAHGYVWLAVYVCDLYKITVVKSFWWVKR